MGITNFNTWLKGHYSKCFISYDAKICYNYIYIDVNHILHTCLGGTEEEFINNIYRNLDQLFCNFVATDKIILAVDGTSPYSKIILQRSRRLQGIDKVNLDSNKISSLHLTPGTQFMQKVNKSLQEYADRLKILYKYVKVEIECIPTNKPGEGEIKIFRKILEHEHKEGINYKTHLVVGNDADLIVLAMAAKPVENIYVMIRHQKKIEILSVKKLINKFVSKLSKSAMTSNKWRSDFAVISFLMGNDYFPKLNFVKFESLWESYYQTIKHVKTNSLIKIINTDTQINIIKYNDKFIKQFFKTVVSNIPKRYHKIDMNTYDEHKIKNYLEGLLWCLHMYQTGICSMIDYMYKYKDSPSPTELVYYLKTVGTTDDICVPESTTEPIREDVFGLLTLPKKTRTLIPDKYQTLIDNQLKYIYINEECTICLNLKTKLSIYHKQLKSNKDKNKEPDIKQNIGVCMSDLSTHKKTHIPFTVKDITNVVTLTEWL